MRTVIRIFFSAALSLAIALGIASFAPGPLQGNYTDPSLTRLADGYAFMQLSAGQIFTFVDAPGDPHYTIVGEFSSDGDHPGHGAELRFWNGEECVASARLLGVFLTRSGGDKDFLWRSWKRQHHDVDRYTYRGDLRTGSLDSGSGNAP